jgi:hypothetical protein
MALLDATYSAWCRWRCSTPPTPHGAVRAIMRQVTWGRPPFRLDGRVVADGAGQAWARCQAGLKVTLSPGRSWAARGRSAGTTTAITG